jgi:hypothetical protein
MDDYNIPEAEINYVNHRNSEAKNKPNIFYWKSSMKVI